MALINYFLVAYEMYLNYFRVANCCCCCRACNCISIVNTHFCPTVWVVACVGVKGMEGVIYIHMCNGKKLVTPTARGEANADADADANASFHLRRIANWNLQYG